MVRDTIDGGLASPNSLAAATAACSGVPFAFWAAGSALDLPGHGLGLIAAVAVSGAMTEASGWIERLLPLRTVGGSWSPGALLALLAPSLALTLAAAWVVAGLAGVGGDPLRDAGALWGIAIATHVGCVSLAGAFRRSTWT